MDILGVDAAVRAVLRVAVDGGGVEQRFGRDAAAVQAGAARLAPLDHGDPFAQLCRAERGLVAAGAGADDDELIISHSVSFLLRAMPPFSRRHCVFFIARTNSAGSCCAPRRPRRDGGRAYHAARYGARRGRNRQGQRACRRCRRPRPSSPCSRSRRARP